VIEGVGGRAQGETVADVLAVGSMEDAALAEQLKSRGLGITVAEARRLRDLLGRDPTGVEAALFDVMWSEHCSYKSSRRTLATLPTSGSHVVLGPGEDAGIVRLAEHEGRSYCLVMAHESHNHPSQVLPVEGAATGIGGIVRDVYCMGAKVIGVMDALRFGDPRGEAGAKVAEIARGVVTGVWQYGNALGVPNLGGDVYFAPCYDENCLVNVVALGLVEEDHVLRSRIPEEAAHEPYDLILIGKPTDSSGYKGASFASKVLDDGGQGDKGAVQVPDPFLKRVLTEATAAALKAMREAGAAVGFKDLGAGGIACAFSEIASRGGFGASIDLDKVPIDGGALPAEVIACSETQERYAMAVPRRLAGAVLKIYNEDYELPRLYPGAAATVIGTATRDAVFTATCRGEAVCRAKVEAITAGVSVEREVAAAGPERRGEIPPAPPDLGPVLLEVAGSLNASSREPVYSYYDWDVQGRTIVRPGEADASVVAPIDGSAVGVAVSVDGNPFYGAIDPYWAGATAVAEAMRNVASVGAAPLAITDCLNYGDPERPEVFRQFVEGVRGVADAARGMWRKGTEREPVPIVSGNVSFYNEAGTGAAVNPSPVVACAGSMADYSRAITMRVKAPGSVLVLVGARRGALGGSAYLRALRALGSRAEAECAVPTVDFEGERAAMHAVIDCIQAGLVKACHDISEGGLGLCAVEMILGARSEAALGAAFDLDCLGSNLGPEEIIFCEAGGFLLEVDPERYREIEETLGSAGVSAWRIGESTTDPVLDITAGGHGIVHLRMEALAQARAKGLRAVWA
jgi:phosphoribosylformylglycinamidine synthase II